jgi:ribulose-5-phosphate 4-epimerase/fuculose-1-phosphate aldolase
MNGSEARIKAAVDPQIFADLVLANRILYSLGVLDSHGHVSVRDPKHPDHFFLSRALAPALVTPEDVMAYDLNASPVEGRGRGMYSERFIHSEIYRARADVHSVVHSHSPTVIPFSISKTALKPVFHMASFMPQAVPVFEVRDTAGMTDLLIKTKELGKALARALGSNSVALLRGHGNVVVGPDVRYAAFRAYQTEINARLQLQAQALQGPLTFIAAEESAKIFGGSGIPPDRAWEMWARQVKTDSRLPPMAPCC